jgi:hypothetical protein
VHSAAAPFACVQEAELLNMESDKDYDLVRTAGLILARNMLSYASAEDGLCADTAAVS